MVRHMAAHKMLDRLAAHFDDGFRHIGRVHQLAALFVDHLALIVHHVVEFQQVFAHIEVARLHLLLRLFQCFVDPRMENRLAFLQAQTLQHPVHALRSEDAHEIVFERQEEFRCARIALTARTAAQLIVDTPAFMAFGADHIETAGGQRDALQLGHFGLDRFGAAVALGFVEPGRFVVIQFLAQAHFEIAAQLNIGAAARHVGGDRHAAGHAGLGDDEGFALVVARVQYMMGNAFDAQQFGEHFALLDADRADQDRLLPRAAFLDQRDDRKVFLARRAIDLVVGILAGDGHVGRDLDHFQLVDVLEFRGFGHGGAGHAGQFRIEAEIVLEGDRGQGLVLVLDRDAFLGFERLMQAFRIAAAVHHAAGEFVDDDDLVVLDDVIDIPREQLMRAQRPG